ncbi:hypothetical protein VSVS12_04121 [Vibrio scophthalmi]|nr:hypothetical protein VSVS12_04121 [Vibrio scophthalmi]
MFNPSIIEARNGNGLLLPKLVGKKLKEVYRKTNRTDVLDLIVRRGKQELRVIRHCFKEEKRYCIWLTNLPRETYTADNTMAIFDSSKENCRRTGMGKPSCIDTPTDDCSSKQGKDIGV